MKNLRRFFSALTFLVILLPQTSGAIEAGDIHVLGGVGYAGTRGILGFSGDYFFTPHQSIFAAFSADIIGGVQTVGYRLTSDATNSNTTIWEKCLFVFECDTHAYVAAGLQHVFRTTAQITSDNVTRSYAIDEKWLGIIGVGTRTVFPNGFLIDGEITARSLFHGGEIRQTDGPAESESSHDLLTLGYHSLGIGIALGYSF